MQEKNGDSDAEKERLICQYRDELYRVYRSRSWRYTAPFRKMDNMIRKSFGRCYWLFFRKIIKALYFLLPVRIRNSNFVERLKNKIKDNEV